jgi:hypothetical protein
MKLKLLVIVAVLFTSSLKAQDKICGDATRYKQTFEWRDLPGCISDYKEDGDASLTTAGLLAYAKMQFKNFYERWEANKILDTDDPIQTYVTACTFFKNTSAKGKWDTDPILKAALPLYEEQAMKVEEAYNIFFTKWKETVEFINQDYVYAEMYMTEIDKAFEDAKGKIMYGQIGLGERAVLRGKVQSIKPLLDKAAALKIPDGLVILGTGDIKEATLAQIRNPYYKKWAAYSAESDKKALEAYEAELAPYLKLMSGEKAKEFRNWYGVYMFGAGGRELKTPQDVANAAAWYSSGTAVCTICPRWKVNSVRFNGNSIAGRNKQEGYGSSAPSSAFK